MTERTAGMPGRDDDRQKAADRAALAKLLRQVMKGACRIEAGGQGEGGDPQGDILLSGAGRQHHRGAILGQAIALGLVKRQGDEIAAASAASAFLRRLAAEREEAFLDQHREIGQGQVEIEGTRQTVRLNLAESPLGAVARLKDRKGEAFLPAAAVEAGERLLSDFTRGQMQPRLTASWEPRLSARTKGRPGGSADLADSAIAARSRFADAMEAMGPELSGVAVDVCCFGKGLELVERERQWPARSAKLMLRTALLALSRHYDPPRPEGRRKSHHWGDEGFRPVL